MPLVKEKDSCPSCSSANTKTINKEINFKYGLPNPVILKATIPVNSCLDCLESWLDYRGEEAREIAVTNHLENKARKDLEKYYRDGE